MSDARANMVYHKEHKKMNALAELKKRIRAGDSFKYMPNANVKDYRQQAYRHVCVEGEVEEVYPNLVVINHGKWKEAFTWAELSMAQADVFVNDKKVIL